MKPAVACLALLASCAARRSPAPVAAPAAPSASTPAEVSEHAAPAPSAHEPSAAGLPGLILQVTPGRVAWQERAAANLTVRLINEAVDCLWVDARMLMCDDRRCELRPAIHDANGRPVGPLYWVQVQPPARDDYKVVLRGQAVETTAELVFRDYDFRSRGQHTLRLMYQDPSGAPPSPPPGCATLDGKAVSNAITIDR